MVHGDNDERTALLSASWSSHHQPGFQALSARRQSLNAIAAGGQSEFGGLNQGLENFRQLVADHRLISVTGQEDPVLDQVRQLAGESGFVIPPERTDNTSDIREAGILAAWATPQVLIGFCRYSIVGSNLITLGRLGTRELAAGNLGFLSSNVGGYALIVGLVSALDTLANQAGKSASPKLTSLYAMKTFVVCMMALPFIFLFMWNALPIFRAIIPQAEADPEILQMASSYLRIMSFAMPAVAAYECLRRYLQSFGLMTGPALAFAVASPVSIFLNWLLVHGPDRYRIGFLGAPLASAISYNLLFVLIAIYTACAAPRGSWCGFSRAIVTDLRVVFVFGLAGVASTCLEWIAFEAIGFAATMYSPATQAATAIYSTSISIFYQFPLGLGAAGAIRVGNLLGRGLPHKAGRSALAGEALTLFIVSFSCILLVVGRHSFFRAFSSDPEVLAIANANIGLLVIIIVFDGVQGINAGILRGAGLPMAAARINLFAYWVLGLPIGAFATYKLKSVAGLYTGLASAVVIATLWMTAMIWRNDWDARAGEAVSRIAINDFDAKILHSPPNEMLEGVLEEDEDDDHEV